MNGFDDIFALALLLVREVGETGVASTFQAAFATAVDFITSLLGSLGQVSR